MAKRYRTRPVEVEAVLFTGDNHDELYEWTEALWDDTHDTRNLFGEDVPFRASVYDKLHDSWISVAPGQYIIKGTKGEFYPCDPETFEWKYEEV